MRTLIAAALPLGLLAACGGQPRIETGTSVPHRDLTLTTSPAATVQVTSGIELATVRTTRRARTTRAAAPVRSAESAIPTALPSLVPPAAAARAPAPIPATAPLAVAAAQPASAGRELAPGATVTVLPASSDAPGSGGSGADWSEFPSPRGGGGVMIGGGHGGTCRGGGGHGPEFILR